MATKRKEKEPEQPHSSRFLSRKHEKHFKVVQDRRLLMERKVGMIPNFAPQFGEQVLGNDWGKLATYPAPANIVVGKEFYTNAKKIGDYPAENYLGYVRGHAIRYDPDSINNFLDTVWAGEQCQFALCMEEGADFEDVERVLCIPGGHFQRNRSGSVVNIRRVDLTPLAKNLNVNIGQVIADEISVCDNTSNNKAPLGHPSLITHLCKIAGVDTSAPPFERPRKAIDEAYYRQYCGGEEAAQPVPPRRAQLQSIHRGKVATAEMIVGMYDTPPAHRWTMEEFHNVVAWPEEQVQGGGAEAAEASVRGLCKASDGLKKGKGTTNVYVDGCVYMLQVWFFEHFVPPEGPIDKFPRILHWMNRSVGDKFVKRCMEIGLVVDDDDVDVGASTKDKKEYRPTPTRKDAQPRPNKIQKRNRRETFMRTLEEQEFLIEELKRRVAGLEAQLAEEKAKRQNKYHGGESVPRTEPSMNTGFVSPTDTDTNQQALKTYVRVGSQRRYKGRALRTPYTRTVVLRIKNE
ncbi:hypothetical protein LR48_Vigan11g057500 [Vigna angularis]|uniref:Putative plant transposon protein domain-containing protein n=1 Tax=Phaseolus angularis TaxID=3914 RepID=A0A0L9VRR1_PHAAN|nr:hypothetical protein LR48_Vigan11g057500 [Vigna angularis]